MNRLVLLVIMVLLVSCDREFKAPKPDNLLEQQKMEDILYDVKFLAAAKSKKYKILKDNNVKVASFVYEKYKIDSTTLHQNIAYYSTNSFKTYKKMEHNIQLRFEAEKAKISAKLKAKDDIRLNKKKVAIQKRGSIGVVVQQTPNLLLDEFDEPLVWSLTNSLVEESNEKNPFGGGGVKKLIANAKSAQHRVNINIKPLKGVHSFSVYAKKHEYSYLRLRIGLKGYATLFDLKNGLFVGSQNGITPKIEKFEKDWYKCTIIYNCDEVDVVRMNIFESDSAADYEGDTLSGLLLWGEEIIKIPKKNEALFKSTTNTKK